MSERGFAAQLAEDLSPEDLRHVLAVFRTDVERLTTVLAAAAGNGDVSGFRRAAHGLAGAAGAVGANALEQACRGAMRETADAANGGVLDGIRARADAALGERARFIAALDVQR